jgi:putative peptidoglycan lipid II flippase
LYQFPLGIFGVALGTVMFPRFARHAEQQRTDLLREDLTMGLELVLCVGIPASLGLVLLGAPLAELFFQYGAFDNEDARQTASMIAGYGWGVWAYCGILIITRAFYALSNQQTPLRIGLLTVGCNLLLNLLLIGPLGGAGLAVASSLASMIQVLLLTLVFQQSIGLLDWKSVLATLLKTLAATATMYSAGWLALRWLPENSSLLQRAMRVGVPFLIATATFVLTAWVIRLRIFWLLFRREKAGNPG